MLQHLYLPKTVEELAWSTRKWKDLTQLLDSYLDPVHETFSPPATCTSPRAPAHPVSPVIVPDEDQACEELPVASLTSSLALRPLPSRKHNTSYKTSFAPEKKETRTVTPPSWKCKLRETSTPAEAEKETSPLRPLPVFILSGPPGCGKLSALRVYFTSYYPNRHKLSRGEPSEATLSPTSACSTKTSACMTGREAAASSTTAEGSFIATSAALRERKGGLTEGDNVVPVQGVPNENDNWNREDDGIWRAPSSLSSSSRIQIRCFHTCDHSSHEFSELLSSFLMDCEAAAKQTKDHPSALYGGPSGFSSYASIPTKGGREAYPEGLSPSQDRRSQETYKRTESAMVNVTIIKLYGESSQHRVMRITSMFLTAYRFWVNTAFPCWACKEEGNASSWKGGTHAWKAKDEKRFPSSGIPLTPSTSSSSDTFQNTPYPSLCSLLLRNPFFFIHTSHDTSSTKYDHYHTFPADVFQSPLVSLFQCTRITVPSIRKRLRQVLGEELGRRGLRVPFTASKMGERSQGTTKGGRKGVVAPITRGGGRAKASGMRTDRPASKRQIQAMAREKEEWEKQQIAQQLITPAAFQEVVEGCGGDLRHALTQLQWILILPPPESLWHAPATSKENKVLPRTSTSLVREKGSHRIAHAIWERLQGRPGSLFPPATTSFGNNAAVHDVAYEEKTLPLEEEEEMEAAKWGAQAGQEWKTAMSAREEKQCDASDKVHEHLFNHPSPSHASTPPVEYEGRPTPYPPAPSSPSPASTAPFCKGSRDPSNGRWPHVASRSPLPTPPQVVEIVSDEENDSDHATTTTTPPAVFHTAPSGGRTALPKSPTRLAMGTPSQSHRHRKGCGAPLVTPHAAPEARTTTLSSSPFPLCSTFPSSTLTSSPSSPPPPRPSSLCSFSSRCSSSSSSSVSSDSSGSWLDMLVTPPTATSSMASTTTCSRHKRARSLLDMMSCPAVTSPSGVGYGKRASTRKREREEREEEEDKNEEEAQKETEKNHSITGIPEESTGGGSTLSRRDQAVDFFHGLARLFTQKYPLSEVLIQLNAPLQKVMDYFFYNMHSYFASSQIEAYATCVAAASDADTLRTTMDWMYVESSGRGMEGEGSWVGMPHSEMGGGGGRLASGGEGWTLTDQLRRFAMVILHQSYLVFHPHVHIPRGFVEHHPPPYIRLPYPRLRAVDEPLFGVSRPVIPLPPASSFSASAMATSVPLAIVASIPRNTNAMHEGWDAEKWRGGVGASRGGVARAFSSFTTASFGPISPWVPPVEFTAEEWEKSFLLRWKAAKGNRTSMVPGTTTMPLKTKGPLATSMTRRSPMTVPATEVTEPLPKTHPGSPLLREIHLSNGDSNSTPSTTGGRSISRKGDGYVGPLPSSQVGDVLRESLPSLVDRCGSLLSIVVEYLPYAQMIVLSSLSTSSSSGSAESRFRHGGGGGGGRESTSLTTITPRRAGHTVTTSLQKTVFTLHRGSGPPVASTAYGKGSLLPVSLMQQPNAAPMTRSATGWTNSTCRPSLTTDTTRLPSSFPSSRPKRTTFLFTSSSSQQPAPPTRTTPSVTVCPTTTSSHHHRSTGFGIDRQEVDDSADERSSSLTTPPSSSTVVGITVLQLCILSPAYTATLSKPHLLYATSHRQRTEMASVGGGARREGSEFQWESPSGTETVVASAMAAAAPFLRASRFFLTMNNTFGIQVGWPRRGGKGGMGVASFFVSSPSASATMASASTPLLWTGELHLKMDGGKEGGFCSRNPDAVEIEDVFSDDDTT